MPAAFSLTCANAGAMPITAANSARLTNLSFIQAPPCNREQSLRDRYISDIAANSTLVSSVRFPAIWANSCRLPTYVAAVIPYTASLPLTRTGRGFRATRHVFLVIQIFLFAYAVTPRTIAGEHSQSAHDRQIFQEIHQLNAHLHGTNRPEGMHNQCHRYQIQKDDCGADSTKQPKQYAQSTNQ